MIERTWLKPVTCTRCGGEHVYEQIRHRGSVYYVDRVCEDCGHIDVDEEGGT